MDIKDRIILLLKKQHKSQLDLANFLSTTPATISRYLSGKLKININALIKIAQFFNVSTDYLLGLEDKTPNISITIFENEIKIYKEVKLSKEDYNTIVDIVNRNNINNIFYF